MSAARVETYPEPAPGNPVAVRRGRALVRGLSLLVLAGLLASAVVVRAMREGTERIGTPEDLIRLRAENRDLAAALSGLSQNLDRILSGFLEARSLESRARDLAGLPAVVARPATGMAPVSRMPTVTHLADRSLGNTIVGAAVRVDAALAQARNIRASFEDIVAEMEAEAEAWARIPSQCPLDGARLTSGYGVRRDPFTGRPRWHYGMDLGAPVGTPVRACADGRVLRSGRYGAYGLLVELDHGNGLQTRYAHNSRLAVGPGAAVRRGQIIAFVGSSGRANAPHLHYEVHLNGQPVNPEPYMLSEALNAE